jgi:hypothetical protein
MKLKRQSADISSDCLIFGSSAVRLTDFDQACAMGNPGVALFKQAAPSGFSGHEKVTIIAASF